MNIKSQIIPEYDLPELFDKTPDWVCVADKDGFFRDVNAAVVNKLGYSQTELYARPIASLIHPADREMTGQLREKLLGGDTLVNFENRYITKSGDVVWLQWTSIYIPNKEIVFAIAKDVTERKENEKAVEEKYTKFKNLATHFKYRIEEDKKHLASELHEELAQLVSVVKLDVDWVRTNVTDLQDTAKGKIEHALLVSELLISTIQRISFSISPKMLEDLGLNATLEWHCRDFADKNGVGCHFESTLDDEHVSPEIQMDLFRICQEAFSAIQYHAEVKHVNIHLEEGRQKISLHITDDGNGSITDSGKEGRLMKSIRERVSSINGHCIIRHRKNEGTRVSVTIDNA